MPVARQAFDARVRKRAQKARADSRNEPFGRWLKVRGVEGAERVAAAVERTADELEGEGDNAISGFGHSVASVMRQLAGGPGERTSASTSASQGSSAARDAGEDRNASKSRQSGKQKGKPQRATSGGSESSSPSSDLPRMGSNSTRCGRNHRCAAADDRARRLVARGDA